MKGNRVTPDAPPTFDKSFQQSFRDLVLWRRDVRRFLKRPVDKELVMKLLELASHSPSVGHAQPWRFVIVESDGARHQIRDSFKRANIDALKGYSGDRQAKYAQLKLEGLDRAPVQIAVFCHADPQEGAGLGRQTMPETLSYSVVGAIHTLWLTARAHGLGLGWVSILEPKNICKALDTPPSWNFIAYLCLGWPEEEHEDPELVRHGWQADLKLTDYVFTK